MYTVSWLVPQQVIVIKLSGHVTAEAMLAMDSEIVPLCAGSPHIVHLLGDLAEAQSLPTLFTLRQLRISRLPNLGWSIGYGSSNVMVRSLLLVTSAVAGTKSRLFKTRAAALHFLSTVDNTVKLPADEKNLL
ncbi:MAG: hypothetical protein MUE40_21110 [Anaerolineae bacterium]|jgi:hypothetical protein|nr:hypothetical protein [Anaerolineae bacterium]